MIVLPGPIFKPLVPLLSANGRRAFGCICCGGGGACKAKLLGNLYIRNSRCPPTAWISSCVSVLVAAIEVMCSGKAHSSIFVFLVAVALAGGAAWFWFDVFVVCGSLAEVVFDAWAAS